MKTYFTTHKRLFAAAIAVLGLANIASAQTAIYISGAPATRAIWNQAILHEVATLTNGTSTNTTGLSIYWTGTTGFNTANQIAITGGNISGTAVTIYGSWTGSTGGNQSVAISPQGSNSALKVGFINLSASGVAPGVVTDITNKQYPHFNLSDTQQTTIPFNGTTTATVPTTSYATLLEAGTPSPAVTGFEFVANKGVPSSLSNITPLLAQQLFTNGSVPLAQFSALNSDTGTQVYAVGRDIASGARYILLAETGIGTANSSLLYQYEPTVSSGTITNIASNPAGSGTINLISFAAGNGGYSSFSNVLTVLKAVSTPSVGYVVSYVTDSDAATAVAAGAVALNWNGVPYSVAGIQQGQYSYWSYLHVYYQNAGATTTGSLPITFATDLGNDLATDTATGAILSSSLLVSRTLDGGIITTNY